MAEIVLNPDIANLDTDPKLASRKTVYTKLLDGMVEANKGEAPDYSQPPYSTKTGVKWTDVDGNEVELTTPNQTEIEKKMAEISSIQMKNAAYLFASVIDTAATTAATGIDLSVLIQKAGDSMTGKLDALHGFQAGLDGNKILDFLQDSNNNYLAHIYGGLIVDDDATIDGQINLGDAGIWFNSHQSIYYANNTLNIDNDHITLKGDVNVDGTFKLGQVEINQNGIFWGTKEFYHNGNANNPTTDWEMKDAHVYGDLTVDGTATYNGRLQALYGFDLGENGDKIFYSSYDQSSGKSRITMETDLNIIDGYGIQFDDKYIIQVRGGGSNIVSFSAPGRIMNLGDSSGPQGSEIATDYISLQADLYGKDGKLGPTEAPIISTTGCGYFPDGLSAKTAVSGDFALQTYSHSINDYGVLFPKMIALGDEYGVKLFTQNNHKTAVMTIPYVHSVQGVQTTDHLGYTLSFGLSNSSWHYPINDIENDISLHFDTEGEFFIFDKPVEAETFSINSLKYKTQLRENALFLREGIFIEGVTDGMAFTGNAYFNDNIQSQRFASGFAGYGWGVIQGDFAGGYHATFDELTIRKKMRVYELEVQKISATNGSLWVSDSCSGDIVEEVTEMI